MSVPFKARFVALLLRILAATWRVKVIGTLPTEPSVVAFWHAQMLPCWYVLRGVSVTALVSPSSDGQILAHLLQSWGYDVLRGSSSHEQQGTLEQLVERAGKGLVALTPDGPRGPRFVAKPGVVIAAHRARVPVVLASVRCSSQWVFEKSWDKFILPKPWSVITITIETQPVVAENAQREHLTQEIERIAQRLIEL